MGNGIVYIYGLVDPRKELTIENVRYVGKTKNTLQRRLSGHISDSKKGYLPIHRWIKKLKKDDQKPAHIILKESDESNWEFDERKYIAELRKTNNLLNISDGGESGYSFKQEVYQYSEDGEYLRNFDSIFDFADFYKIRPQAISKIIDQKGQKSYRGTYLFSSHEKANVFKFTKTLKHMTPIVQYTLDGIFVSEYKSQTEAERKTNIIQSGINLCLKGKCKQFKNFHWFYKNGVPKNIVKYRKYSTNVKPIIQYNLDGNLINEFESISDATRKLNISSGHIVTTIKKSKQCRGFIFKYKDDTSKIIPEDYNKYPTNLKPINKFKFKK